VRLDPSFLSKAQLRRHFGRELDIVSEAELVALNFALESLVPLTFDHRRKGELWHVTSAPKDGLTQPDVTLRVVRKLHEEVGKYLTRLEEATNGSGSDVA